MHLNLFNGLVLLCFDETCMEHLCLIQSLFIIFLSFHIDYIVYIIKQLRKKRRVCKIVLDSIFRGPFETGPIHSRMKIPSGCQEHEAGEMDQCQCGSSLRLSGHLSTGSQWTPGEQLPSGGHRCVRMALYS